MGTLDQCWPPGDDFMFEGLLFLSCGVLGPQGFEYG